MNNCNHDIISINILILFLIIKGEQALLWSGVAPGRLLRGGGGGEGQNYNGVGASMYMTDL